MTGAQIISFFRKLIDDNLNADFELNLLNLAKEQIEAERDWEMLKKKDKDSSSTVGGTYETAYALPADFLRMVKVNLGDLKIFPIPFQDQITWKDSARRYFIDHATSPPNFYLTGSVATSETLYWIYIYNTDDLTASTSPVWPAKFHKLLAFEMSELYFAGLDIDDVEKQKVPKHREQRKILMERMIQWDMNLKLESMDYSGVPPGIGLGERDNVLENL